MNNSITFKNHPFKFLLYLEWTLLTIAILIEFIPIQTPLPPTYRPFQGAIESPMLNFICLGILPEWVLNYRKTIDAPKSFI